jgi:hypothetical protein
MRRPQVLLTDLFCYCSGIVFAFHPLYPQTSALPTLLYQHLTANIWLNSFLFFFHLILFSHWQVAIPAYWIKYEYLPKYQPALCSSWKFKCVADPKCKLVPGSMCPLYTHAPMHVYQAAIFASRQLKSNINFHEVQKLIAFLLKLNNGL